MIHPTYCQRSWSKGHGSPSYFCVLIRGHAGECLDSHLKPKRADQRFYEDQPETHAIIQKQVDDERKVIAKKEANK